jgi:hypothetical protein
MNLMLGATSLAVSFLLFIAYFLKRRKLAPISVTVTFAVAHVRELAEAFAQYTSAQTFRQLVEVKGRVACAEPLLAPLSEKECVHYSVRVRWEYEEIYYEEKPDGERLEHQREADEILFEEKQWTPFFVRDDTGDLAVLPAGCEVIAAETLSRHEEDAGLADEEIHCGRFAMPAPWKTAEEERRPLRYHFEEQAIEVGSEIYVLAEATNEGGELRLQKPRRGGKFLISVKPEEELIRSAQAGLCAVLVATLLFGAGGVILLLL